MLLACLFWTASELIGLVNEPLCQVFRVPVKLLGDMSQVELKINSREGFHITDNIVLGVTKSSEGCLLLFPDGTELGLLNTRHADAFGSIMDLPSVQLEALADLITLRDTLHRVTKASEANVRVNINVYGSKATQKDVGRLLSAGKVFLQHPDKRGRESKYDNPHVITFPGIQVPDPNSGLEIISGHDVREDPAEQFQKAVSNVYASLKRSSHLQRLEGDRRLRTPLLK